MDTTRQPFPPDDAFLPQFVQPNAGRRSLSPVAIACVVLAVVAALNLVRL